MVMMGEDGFREIAGNIREMMCTFSIQYCICLFTC